MSRIPYGIMPLSFGAESEEERRRRLGTEIPPPPDEWTPEPEDQRGAVSAVKGPPSLEDPGFQRHLMDQGTYGGVKGRPPAPDPEDADQWPGRARRGYPNYDVENSSQWPGFGGKPGPQEPRALQPRPLIPQEAVPFTQADSLQLQKLQQGRAQVQEQLSNAEITEQEAGELQAQLAQKMAPLEQRKSQFEQQQKQQGIQQQMQDQALAFGMQQQNGMARAKGFPQTVSSVVDEMTGEITKFFQQPDGQWTQITKERGGGEGSVQGEELDYFPPPIAQMQVAQAGQYGDNPPGPMAPPDQSGEQLPEPGAQGGAMGPPAPTEQTYGTPQGPEAPAPKQSSGRVMSIGTPEYGTAAHQRQVQQAAQFQQLRQQGMPAKMAQAAVYYPQRLQVAQQAAQMGMDSEVTDAVLEGTISTREIRAAQQMAQQVVGPPPQFRGDARLYRSQMAEYQKTVNDRAESILNRHMANKAAQQGQNFKQTEAEKARVFKEQQAEKLQAGKELLQAGGFKNSRELQEYAHANRLDEGQTSHLNTLFRIQESQRLKDEAKAKDEKREMTEKEFRGTVDKRVQHLEKQKEALLKADPNAKLPEYLKDEDAMHTAARKYAERLHGTHKPEKGDAPPAGTVVTDGPEGSTATSPKQPFQWPWQGGTPEQVKKVENLTEDEIKEILRKRGELK